ncbi:MAG: UDP-N-acetylmuramoyl-L-alanyl-D-glutamate--2,6-diaminopimelate ligase [Opitutales bacterium]
MTARPVQRPTFRQLLEGIAVSGRSGDWDAPVSGVVTDSRRVLPGSLFFALPGLRSDGAAFIDEAVGRGASAVVSGSSVATVPGVAAAQVAAPRRVLAEVARRFHGHPERALTLAGVTGTNGKTTVSTLLRHLLQSDGSAWGLVGTVRYHLGRRTVPSYKTTPESADLAAFFREMADAGCAGACLEVSSHALHQDRVHGFDFAVAGFTNLTRDHVDYHGDLGAYLEAKTALFDGRTGTVPLVSAVNLDDAAGRSLAQACGARGRVIGFGRSPDADLRAEDVTLDPAGAAFTVRWGGASARFVSSLPGGYNVENVLCALAMAAGLGRDPLALAGAVADFPGVSGRMERVEAGQEFPVFVDYAHTDDALRNALGMLRSITPGRVLCVFGCGGSRDRGKRPAMTAAVAGLAHRAWATADNPRRERIEDIFADMRAAPGGVANVSFVPDRREAIALAVGDARPGDCVLVAGKGHETTQEFADTVVPFDDRQVVRQVIALRRGRSS